MSTPNQLKQLEQLVDLREREVERLSADVAGQQAVRRRYLGNLSRLEQLCNSSGPSGAQAQSEQFPGLSVALALNCGGYKQAVMKMADTHRIDLSLHESEMALTQRRMIEAARRHEALDAALERQRADVRRFRKLREQKRQDEIASQVWQRGRG
ncbi:MAG TPA: flagellar export protein FliJ [Steroidobacteraceae bacterium]|jgi:flagellar export protein FliJ